MRLVHFQSCVWRIFSHAFGAFWVMRLAHFQSCVWRILGHQAQRHSLDLRSDATLGLSLYYTLFSNL